MLNKAFAISSAVCLGKAIAIGYLVHRSIVEKMNLFPVSCHCGRGPTISHDIYSNAVFLIGKLTKGAFFGCGDLAKN